MAQTDKGRGVVGQKVHLLQQVVRKEVESESCDWLLLKQVALIVKAEGFS